MPSPRSTFPVTVPVPFMKTLKTEVLPLLTTPEMTLSSPVASSRAVICAAPAYTPLKTKEPSLPVRTQLR